MTTDEKNTPEPAETENRNLKAEYDAQVIEEDGDLNDIDSPLFNGPDE
jgi:hypothetical protein